MHRICRPAKSNGYAAIEAAGRGLLQAPPLLATLHGLRNWPEAMVFPERVAAAELDITSTGCPAFRLKKRSMGNGQLPARLSAVLNIAAVAEGSNLCRSGRAAAHAKCINFPKVGGLDQR